jgi:hypothetical protein
MSLTAIPMGPAVVVVVVVGELDLHIAPAVSDRGLMGKQTRW